MGRRIGVQELNQLPHHQDPMGGIMPPLAVAISLLLSVRMGFSFKKFGAPR